MFERARDNAYTAWSSLRESWLRSILTMTGIVIGVMAVVTLVAILQGVKTEVSRGLEDLGENLVLIVPGKLDADGQPNPMAMIGISPLTPDDLTALRKVPGVQEVSPVTFVSGVAQVRGRPPVPAFVVATDASGVRMNPARLAEGQYFTAREEDANVCVLAYRPRQALFGAGPAVGRTVQTASRSWRVVGVLGKPAQDSMMSSQILGLGLGNLIYLPYRAARAQVPGGQVNRIVLRTDYDHPAKTLIASLNAALVASHNGRQDFGVFTQERGLALVSKLLDIARALLVLIAAISLFVAGVGVMNIMLVTVTERTREIGIRKTVGARRRDIFAQFLTEAIILATAGGVLGLGLSWLLCDLIARFSPLAPQITGGAVAMALGTCGALGALFGVAPAIRASRMNPIDALRYE